MDRVTLQVTLLGGGFGRRLEVDFVAQAVRVAMDCGGKPVQLIWSREEDMTHDFYRPMQVTMLRAALGPQGGHESAHQISRRRRHIALAGAQHSGLGGADRYVG